MRLLSRRTRLALTFLGLNVALAASCFAQAKPSAERRFDSGIDIYAGYGLFQPLNSYVYGYQYHELSNPNATGSIAYYFKPHFGAQVEGSYFQGNPNNNNQYGTCAQVLCNQRIYTAQGGPIYRFTEGPFIPFFHALGGGVRMNGPEFSQLSWGYGATVGGGVDYVLPILHRHFAIRPAQVDYQYAHINYGPPPPSGTYLGLPNSYGGTASINAVKLSAGLVVHLREAEETVTPLVYGCSASPVDVFPGEMVTVTGSTVGLKSKHTPEYSWATKGGVVTSNGATATIDTTGLEPGQYDVIGRISVGPRPGEQSYCSAPFNVKAYTAPTIACTGSVESAEAGATLEVDCTGRSEQNRPLTYTFTTNEGQLSVNNNIATVSTAGLPPGTITVSGTVKDDKGKSASAQVVFVIKPPVIKTNPVSQLCMLRFSRDERRPARVDNEAKGCLDSIALALNRASDAKLVVVGNSDPAEKPEVAAERALNAREYLVHEKGIDTNRISVRVGETSGKTVKSFLVPAGATFSEPNTQRFDEKRIVRHGPAYGVPRKPGAKPVHHAVKKAAAKPAVPQPATK